MDPKIVNCPYCGKILPKDVWKWKNSMRQEAVKCSYCGSQWVCKNGFRFKPSGERVQRYYCSNYGRRSSRLAALL